MTTETPERAAYKRAWENAMRASCSRCGQPMGAGTRLANGSARKTVGHICAGCMTEARVDRVLAMVKGRRDGLSNAEIATRLDVPVTTVQVELSRLRTLGYEVPLDSRSRRKPAATYGPLQPEAVTLGRVLRERGITPP
jgi:hypothetical protein